VIGVPAVVACDGDCGSCSVYAEDRSTGPSQRFNEWLSLALRPSMCA
jgi:hypothetical protein